MSINTQEITVSLGQLYLDPNNYRLNEGGDLKKYSTDEIVAAQKDIRVGLLKKNIADLEKSILSNGFLEVDKIVVRELDSADSEFKKFLVIEGNRRTAAYKSVVKSIESGEIKESEFPIVNELLEKAKSINVVLVTGSEEQILDYSRRLMGIRHVSGPKKWGGYQSARLINDMYEAELGYKEISSLLGMSPKEAQKKREAYLAFNQMMSDEVYGPRVSTEMFSLFVEVVSANSTFKEKWLGWDPKSCTFRNIEELRRLYHGVVNKDDGKAELSNPTSMREFSKAISIPEVREQIEKYVKFRDVDYDFDAAKRINKISKFRNFIENFHDFNEHDRGELKKIYVVLNEMFSVEDGE